MLRQDRDGQWWYESLSGAPLSTWVADALRSRVPPRECSIAWGDADRDAHRRGVLDCLEAIAAGEVYQACVCTQFAGRLDGAPVDFFVDAVDAHRRPRGRPTWPATGVRWRRCRRSCSCGAAVRR